MKVENKKLPILQEKCRRDNLKPETSTKICQKKKKRKKRKYQKERYYMPNLNEKLKQYQRDYYE